MNKKLSRNQTFLLVTVPVLALFFCFNTLPLIKGLIYSFTNFKGFGSYDWVGMRNYADLFTDARVGKSYLFTFKFAILATVLTNVIAPPRTGLKWQDQSQERFKRYVLRSENPRRTGCRLYLRIYLHIHPSSTDRNRKYALQRKDSLDRHRYRYRMAVHSSDDPHLYLRSSDRTGRCI